MKLKKLLQNLDGTLKGSKEVEITGISSDSRRLAFGNLFLAKRGGKFDGTEFIDQAISTGASAVVTDIYDPFLKVPQFIHPNVASIEPILASRYYGYPSKELFVVGITGTKGKTTTSYLISHLLEPCGLIGTIEVAAGKVGLASTLTTHDAIFNQKWLREMVSQKCAAVAIEVSSHGLDQNRVDEIEFDLGVFTNLTEDHLDYHKDVNRYAGAKKRLFSLSKKGIFNADSPWAKFMGEGLTYGIEKGEIRAEKIVYSEKGTEFQVANTSFFIPLIGKFNVYNALAAISVGIEKGMKLGVIGEKLKTFQSVPGRLQKIKNVFIDFAHSGEALENVLQTLRQISDKKIIVVFGAGGDRPQERRLSLAKAADHLADVAIITNDNPRTEDPEQIANQIKSGFQNLEPLIELDRRKAIQKAIEIAGKKDLVLVAGKGHEKGQIFSGKTVPFDDVAVVKELLK